MKTYFHTPESFRRSLFIFGASILGLALSGCAVLHKVQVGQIDDRNNEVLIPFEIKVSETGVSTEEIGAIAKATKTRAGNDAAGLAGAVSLFQLGPRTGLPVYDQRYAERLIYAIHEKCPSGRVTGLMSIREMRKYPVVSGEIVKVTGFCRKPRKQAALTGEIETVVDSRLESGEKI